MLTTPLNYFYQNTYITFRDYMTLYIEQYLAVSEGTI